MKSPESSTTQVFLKNDPKMSEHEADASRNESIRNLVPIVKNFLSDNPRFKGHDAHVTFSHEGVSSLVSIIEFSGQKLVLKIPLRQPNSSDEFDFFEVWKKAGIKTPHVLEKGMIGNHSYLLMEYIDAPLIKNAYTKQELIEKGVYFDMGRTLRAMHGPEAVGFGPVLNGKAKFDSFDASIEDNKEKFAYVKDNSLLGEEFGSLDKALAILKEHINREARNSYCHSDFAVSNIFATKPITVFDPNPNFNNRYVDVARSMIKIVGEGVSPQQFIDGYFEGEVYSKEVLHSAFLFVIYLRISHSHKTNKDVKIQRWQKYLIENKYLLE